jgi:hypothetical protein
MAWLWLMIGSLTAAPEPSAPAAVGTGSAGEYEIKAAYLRNFVLFVEWPAAAMGPGDEPVVIGVFDPTPFGPAFPSLQGKTVKRRAIKIRVCRSIDDAQRCHVVFVNPREPHIAATVLKGLVDKPVLTVGETPGFLQDGGVIRFAESGGRVRLEISLAAALRANLRISSQLLELAKVTDNVRAP